MDTAGGVADGNPGGVDRKRTSAAQLSDEGVGVQSGVLRRAGVRHLAVDRRRQQQLLDGAGHDGRLCDGGGGVGGGGLAVVVAASGGGLGDVGGGGLGGAVYLQCTAIRGLVVVDQLTLGR